ncbi:PREDICTED: gibberellin-regulated protein 14 isoform X2 [Lupinus angustifolius]|uniref:gibberellin-regulated protein 14 isoform X2 n=1 Tax=Lupinus angustifolius TaxID=3871 RepID=UPI00092EA7C0|nr:PREDICTED: gibberellin-regulated protein 14 isoform X2 [Lupinus angustifolius]
MAFKSFILLLISLLVLTTKVSSYDEVLNIVPILRPIPSTPIKAPTTPSPPPVKAPPPSPPPVKPPTPPPSPPPTTPSSPAQPPVAPAPIVKSDKDCIPLCGYRCQLHSRKQICVRACVTCCDRCKCVPPGTYGNRDKCGKCYTDMLTHGNRPKCP